jgi:ribosomal protein L11 methylase PrmA
MNRFGAMAALLAGAALVAGCGRDEDGSPTAAENAQLNNISEVLDTSADSLVAEEPALGNGEAGAESGDLPVVANEVVNGQ